MGVYYRATDHEGPTPKTTDKKRDKEAKKRRGTKNGQGSAGVYYRPPERRCRPPITPIRAANGPLLLGGRV